MTADQQEALTERVDVLADRGPDLGRPVVERIARSRHHNMKELRASEGGALRVLFAFDPRRHAIWWGQVGGVERLVCVGGPGGR